MRRVRTWLALALVLGCAAMAARPKFIGSITRLGSAAFSFFPSASSQNLGGLLYDETGAAPMFSNGTSWLPLEGPVTLSSVYVNALLSVLTFGGEQLPARSFEVQAVRYRISVPGAIGSTDATFRISDGTSNCDCNFACDLSAGSKRMACSGTCVMPASAALSYAFISTGDCVTAPTILGNVAIEGRWR